jgi:hypothetical protein
MWDATVKTVREHLADGPVRKKPRYVCADGFSVSIQADKNGFCTPEQDGLGGNYTTVELGFPSDMPPDYILPYDLFSTGDINEIYGFVPIDLVQRMLDEHNLKGIS